MIVSNSITMEYSKASRSQKVILDIKNLFKLQNPEHANAMKYGRSSDEIPPTLYYYRIKEEGDKEVLLLPRGAIREIIEILDRNEVKYTIEDLRIKAEPPKKIEFNGRLKPHQEKTIKNIRPFGTIVSPTGSGKTVMAIKVMADRNMKTMILCHTTDLVKQWKSRILSFTNLEDEDIGICENGGSGGENLQHKIVVISTIQTMEKLWDELKEEEKNIGFLIADECHRVPAKTFVRVVTKVKSFYMLGLSATPYRRDRLDPVIFWFIGPVCGSISTKELVEAGELMKPVYKQIPTDLFVSSVDPSTEYSRMMTELTTCERRNSYIVGQVFIAVYSKKKVCLVLSDRKEHCAALSDMLLSLGVKTFVLNGDTKKEDREEIREKVASAENGAVLIATSQLIGEGYDLAELEVLFLTTPLKFVGRLVQYIGRVLRNKEGKEAPIVYDFVDTNVGLLVRSARMRENDFIETFGE